VFHAYFFVRNDSTFEYLRSVKMKFLELLGKDQPICQIEEIDIEKRIIIIHSRGVAAPIKEFVTI